MQKFFLIALDSSSKSRFPHCPRILLAVHDLCILPYLFQIKNWECFSTGENAATTTRTTSIAFAIRLIVLPPSHKNSKTPPLRHL
jgi:hypothetical protein